MLSLLDSDFKLLFFGGSRSSSPLALVLEVEGPEGLLKKEFIFDIYNENHEEQQHSNAHVWHRASVQYLWPVVNKKGAFLSSAPVRCFIRLTCHLYIPSCVRTAFCKCLGDMDDSNSQTFVSRYFCLFADYQNHSHFASLCALISSPGF